MLNFFYIIKNQKIALLDAAETWAVSFQDPATPVMEGIIHFHNDIMFFILLIGTFVTYLLFKCLHLFYYKKHPKPECFVHGTTIEIIWTTIPAFILLIIAVPSFALLYAIDETIEPSLTLKIIGHQWYWSYEYGFIHPNLNENESLEEKISFDAYMVPEEDLPLGALRLLETDRRVVLPKNTHIRTYVTSDDVLHSWCVPSFGAKLDACPGRLNELDLFIKREGTFYGQCSEICGINHAFMPIVVEVLDGEKFLNYLST